MNLVSFSSLCGIRNCAIFIRTNFLSAVNNQVVSVQIQNIGTGVSRKKLSRLDA